MGRSAFQALGYSLDNAQALVNEFNERDQKLMLEAASLYKVDVPPAENQPYLDKVKELNQRWQHELLGKTINKNLDSDL